MRHFIFQLVLVAVALSACGNQKKITNVRQNALNASLMLPPSDGPREISTVQLKKDTLVVQDDDGREMLIMKAVRDENGEMVANDVIDAAVVTARFRNVAERHGKVDLRFRIVVPEEMRDSKWQLRFHPLMNIMGQSVALDSILISGSEYRKAQLRGYEQYEKFLRTIITDSSLFVHQHELEVFLKRNIPQLYSLKTDSTFVSDELFESIYGVTQKEAVGHYTSRARIRANVRRIGLKDKMYSKYVKVPIISEGLRLDTVVTSANGSFIYEYVQTINTMPKLKNVEICLSGSIYQEDNRIYTIPDSDPLTFYISSLSSFVDDSEHFMTKIVERKVQDNAVCWIDFESGSSVVTPSLSNNSSEIGRIKKNLSDLLENIEFDLDSIIVTASCSPEGSFSFNQNLSHRRSLSVTDYFKRYLRRCKDSLNVENGFSVNLDRDFADIEKPADIRFISRNEPENWKMFSTLIREDPIMEPVTKNGILGKLEIPDLDEREAELSRQPYYQYLREKIYPRLRTVRFDFYLHRKGMVKDTVHTTVLDTAYMRGVQAIVDRDYQTAVSILRPYRDFNAAVALCAMDYNASALDILKHLELTDKVEYMMAIVYSRNGDEQKAVQYYINACKKNPSFVHRGNLDPEISSLIKTYGLNNE